ncbi:hypothetical protein R1sor_003837 [Riccia sorocarpa]|uniref:Tubulin--tyrosine ligase-like protein 12 SET-like domain-containing protein n=1 Tax=Riccia sorocarpa TaxID=122646 RepID=A0ABD3H2T3_9MARC
MDLEKFEVVHGILLASAGLPRSLFRQLHSKLTNEIFDAGNCFEIEPCEDGRQRRLLLTSDALPKESQVFLVDHAWSFRLTEARKQLETVDGLAKRMATLMCVVDEAEEDDGESETEEPLNAEAVVENAKRKAQEDATTVKWLEFDNLEVTDDKLRSLDLSTRFADLVGLSLWGTRVESLDALLEGIRGLSALRALWINNTPLDDKLGNVAKDAIVKALPSLELYNRHFTKSCTSWAVGFCAGVYGPENPVQSSDLSRPLQKVTDLDLSDRTLLELDPKVLSPLEIPELTSLNIKENPVNQSSASLLEILRSFKSLVSLQVDIPGPLGNSALEIAKALPDLRSINGVEVDLILKKGMEILDSDLKPRLPTWSPGEPLVDRVLKAMWHYVMTYRLADEEKLDETPVWYVMDELGSALRHSDVPNFRVAPFMYLPDGTLNSAISYSLLWPVKNVIKGEECTRDYLCGIGEDKQRSARLTAWFHTPTTFFAEAYSSFQKRLASAASEVKKVSTEGTGTKSILPSNGRPLSVFSDIPYVQDFLRRPEFVLTDKPSEADVLWTSAQIDEDFIKAAGIRPDQYVNQFPFESCLVMKHHLAQTMQQAYGSPPWLQPTYDMERDLAALIGDYLHRERSKQNNLWIVKPWNMARTIDTTVTSNLPQLIRLVETGPKIGQKYIDPPATFQGRKFDLRYIVLLRSVQPLEVFLCDVFWARFSNNKYTTEESSLTEYETHFTVMNYGRQMNHVNTHDFVPEFEREHNVRWKDIHEKVKLTLRKVFEAPGLVHPEMQSARARAMYGVDLMLDDNFEPKLLEVTYCPDCARACKYDVRKVVGDGGVMRGKDFVNSVFGCLFLNEETNMQRL